MELRPSSYNLIPPVIKNILIINGLMFLMTIVLYQTFQFDLSQHLALYHWESPKFRIWQFMTHMFMHGNVSGPGADYSGGLMHLFFNMFALWMFGSVLENKMGSKRFLSFYLLCGLGAAICYLAILSIQFYPVKQSIHQFANHPSPEAFRSFVNEHIGTRTTEFVRNFMTDWDAHPQSTEFRNASVQLLDKYYTEYVGEGCVGASGAVYGIFFAFAYLFPNQILYLNFFIPVRVKYAIGIFAAIELFLGIQNNPGDNVAHFAHLGGMLAAFIILKFWKIRYNSG